MFQIKVVQHWIPYKKVNWRACLSPSRVELGGSKDCHLWNTILQKWESRFSLGLTLQKIRIIRENALSKSCSALNSIKKSQWARMFTSLWSVGEGLKDCHCLNIIMYKNGEVNSVWGAQFYPPHSVARGLWMKFSAQQHLLEAFSHIQ